MPRIIGFIILLINVLAIIDVWKREPTVERKLLWTIVILLVPGLGALGWYVISRGIINL
ncbi:MAG: PLDc N-terminal domain-containing protein [Flammeovirgaceae bacterium]|nr:PLDc N-terminal domain-containing protein [Flammeovirgaceae bacterium]